MRKSTSRGLLYGGAAVVLAGLVYGGFVRKVDQDWMTALSSAQFQMRIAYGMPAQDKAGHPLAAREQLLTSAAEQLAAAARQVPDSPVLVEMQGFLASLRGDARTAAALYRQARMLPGCDADQRDTLVFNEARMLAQSGDRSAALAVLTGCGAGTQPKFADQLILEQASLLYQLGKSEGAVARLDLLMSNSKDPMAWMSAGSQYADMGRNDAADAAFAKAATQVPVADYHRAKLKLTAGEVDTCLGLLENAVKANPTDTRRLLQQDAATWQVLADNARYQQASAPASAAPGR